MSKWAVINTHIYNPSLSTAWSKFLIFGKCANVSEWIPNMWFSSRWLKRPIRVPLENSSLGTTVTVTNHNTVNAPSSKWDQLSPDPARFTSKREQTWHSPLKMTFRYKWIVTLTKTGCCLSARHLKSFVCVIIHTFVCLRSASTTATQLLPLTIYISTFLLPSLLLLLSVCLCPGRDWGSVFIVRDCI